MAKLILLYKDFNSDLRNFDFLGDVIVHNQFPQEVQEKRRVALKRHESPISFFEANDEEYLKMKWFAEFSQQDVVYAIERDALTCKKLVQGGSPPKFKGVDIVLVYYQLNLYCIKHSSGRIGTVVKVGNNVYNYDLESSSLFRQKVNQDQFAAFSTAVIFGENDDWKELFKSRRSIKEQLLMSTFEPICHDCGVENIHIVDIYITSIFSDTLIVPLLSYNFITSIEEVDKYIEGIQEEIFVLCANCSCLRNL